LKEERTTLDRILSAFGHPVRRRILRQLAEGPASASVLSRSFKLDLGVVSYHLGQVLGKQLQVVELVDSIPRRGSMEKIYGLKGLEGPLKLPAAGKPGSREEMEWTMALVERLFEAASGKR
jgi:DNA-binding transcriptional ArsR family regulator